jgi:DNA-binding winged helix-turn-helix (wHTH) protein
MSVNSSLLITRFGTFEVNLQTGELRHAGQKVKLQEQPFQVLATLLERPGEVVTRDAKPA